MGTQLSRIVGSFTAAIVGSALLALPVHAQELSIEKVVSQVNGSAPPASEVISVQPGDTVAYGISVTGVADLGGTDVIIRDVFESDVLEFQEASESGCTASAGEVTCTLTLDDEGGTSVELTFEVLEVDDCQRLVNTAEVTGDPDLTASSEAEIEACPTSGGAQGGNGGSGQPDTAMPQAGNRGAVSPATVAGLLLLLLSAVVAGRRQRAVPTP